MLLKGSKSLTEEVERIKNYRNKQHVGMPAGVREESLLGTALLKGSRKNRGT